MRPRHLSSLLVGSLSLTAVVATVFAAAAQAHHTQTEGTKIFLYAPFNGDAPAAGIVVGRIVRGYCWTSSNTDARGDAYRCFVGNYIHDPCFANQTGSSLFVLCPLYLPNSKVLRINLTKPLPPNPASGDPTHSPPWAVKLGDGRWCEILSGATGLIAGMRINYGCTGGAILIGNPRRGTATWTIFYVKSAKARAFQPVPISQAWW